MSPNPVTSPNRDERPRILIVDDEVTNLQVVGEMLQLTKKYQINIAQSGREALSLTKKLAPDLILLDVMMPGMSGYEVCHTLKQNPLYSHIPIIFLTAKNQVEDLVVGLKMGGADYITKPFQPMILMARIEAQLALHLYHKSEEEKRRLERYYSYQNGLNKMRSEILHNIGNTITGSLSRISNLETLPPQLNTVAESLVQTRALLLSGEESTSVIKALEMAEEILRDQLAQSISENSEPLKKSIRTIAEILRAQQRVTHYGLEPSTFSLTSLLSDIAIFSSETRTKHQIQLTIKPFNLPEISLPRGPLTQVMADLVTNSIEAIEQAMDSGVIRSGDGEITISASQILEYPIDCPSWDMRIVDNGIGINREHQSSALSSGYTTKPKESGFGLHNAANFILSCGGEIDIERNETQQGTTIHIQLPFEYSPPL